MKGAFSLLTETHMEQGDITTVFKQCVRDLWIFLQIKNMTTNSYYNVLQNSLTLCLDGPHTMEFFKVVQHLPLLVSKCSLYFHRYRTLAFSVL